MGDGQRRRDEIQVAVDAQGALRQQPIESAREPGGVLQPLIDRVRLAGPEMRPRRPEGAGGLAPRSGAIRRGELLEIARGGFVILHAPGGQAGNPIALRRPAGGPVGDGGGVLHRLVQHALIEIGAGDLGPQPVEFDPMDMRTPSLQIGVCGGNADAPQMRANPPLGAPVALPAELVAAGLEAVILDRSVLPVDPDRGSGPGCAGWASLKRQPVDLLGIGVVRIGRHPAAQLRVGRAPGGRVHIALIQHMPHQPVVADLFDQRVGGRHVAGLLKREDAPIEIHVLLGHEIRREFGQLGCGDAAGPNIQADSGVFRRDRSRRPGCRQRRRGKDRQHRRENRECSAKGPPPAGALAATPAAAPRGLGTK